jgi:hypothetical protein
MQPRSATPIAELTAIAAVLGDKSSALKLVVLAIIVAAILLTRLGPRGR